ncbi:MAG TPA: TMEM175 family protein [Vicinamibacterales bacterium]|nr:TMEM175 family protein [Vicinamibacterales bacterium]
MRTSRLEAFSDGVIAILITIMVLELRLPPGADWGALRSLGATLCAYILSFIYLGIYWSNHHHLFHLVERVTGGILWANLHLLFWLSLVPFATNWMGENPHAPLPTAAYGVVLICAAIAYTILVQVIIHSQGAHSKLKAAVGSDRKGNVSIVMYAAAVASTLWHHEIAWTLYAAVALMWLVPDRRIERTLEQA